jgi:hypothetical protein
MFILQFCWRKKKGGVEEQNEDEDMESDPDIMNDEDEM